MDRPNPTLKIRGAQHALNQKNRENLKIAISRLQKSRNQRDAIFREPRNFEGSIQPHLRKRPMLVSAPPSGDKPKGRKRICPRAPGNLCPVGHELAPRVFQFVTAQSGD